MTVDDITLMAYVDGELDAELCREVEIALDVSLELTERLRLFRQSLLPYQRAFATQKLPSVPEALTLKIAELAQGVPSPASQALDIASAANDAAALDSAKLSHSISTRSKAYASVRWLAVAFVAGAFFCNIALRLAPRALPNDAVSTAASTGQTSPWVMTAATYQALYTRETVATTTDPTVSAKTVKDIHYVDNMPVRVPDLTLQGLTFKRIQRLRFHGKRLVQIVYLPKSGDPVALCVIKDPNPDATLEQQNVNGMKVVTWRQSELGYALIGPITGPDLDKLGRLIAERGLDQMFG